MDTVPPPPPAAAQPVSPATGEDKTVAIVSYLSIVGFIIAIVMHGNKKTQLGSYHLRQTLGLLITSFVASMPLVIPLLGLLIFFPAMIFLFVLWIIGFIGAINGQFKPVPLLGTHYQKWFGTAFE